MRYINKNIFNLILISSGIAFLYFCYPFFAWLLLGAILSFSIKPIQNKFLIQKYKLNKKISVYLILTSILLVFIPIILSLITFITEVKKAYETTADSDSISIVENSVKKSYETVPALSNLVAKKDMIKVLKSSIKKLIEPMLKIASDFFLSLPMLFLGIFIFILSIYFFISDSNLIYDFIIQLDLIDKNDLDRLIDIIQISCQSTIFAAFITGAVQSLILALTALFLGLDFFFTIFFISLFFAQIPLVGTSPVTLVLLGYFYSTGANTATLLMLVAGVVAGFSDNFIRPYVLSKYDSLHSLAGLIASLGALIVFGPIGVLLGPVIALLFVKVLKEKFRLSRT